MGLKKAWDKWGKGSKLARGLAFTKKGKAKVDQDRIDKADEKQKQKDTKADAQALKYDKDEEGNIKKQPDAQTYKDTTGKAPSGWKTSPDNSPGKGKVWTTDDQTKWDAEKAAKDAASKAAAEKKAEKAKQKKIDKEKKTGQANKAQRDKRAAGGPKGGRMLDMSPAERKAKLDALRKKRGGGEKKEEGFYLFAQSELASLTEEDRSQLLEELVLEETMTLEESNELQAIMALDDVGISAEINRKGEVVVKKKDLKKAQKALKKSFRKGGEPKLVGEGVRTAYEVVSEARSKIMEVVDEHAVVELYNFMQNERDLQRQKDSIIKNIVRKKKSGKYDHSKAPKLWEYWVENGAKAYDKLYSSPGAKTFDKDTRRSLAIQFANEYNAEIDLGNYS